MTEVDPTTDSPRTTSQIKDRAQFGLCAALGLIGIVVVADAMRMSVAGSTNDPLGPRALPVVIGGGLVVVAGLLALSVARGSVGVAESGEDIDTRAPSDWRTVAIVGGGFLLNALLIERLGWVISGSLLFGICAYGLGSKHPIRAFGIGLVLSLITFYLFGIQLDVNLPAGVLKGIL